MSDTHRSIAIASAERIRKYWRERNFEGLEVRIIPGTYEIKSNMENGYPPRRK